MAKILFLEDEKMIREVLSEYMAVAGYEVIPFDRGDNAIKFVAEGGQFEIAVLDVRVPASPIILIKRIEAVLRRTGKSISSEMEHGFVVDEEEFRAYYNRKNLRLTVSEFVLMKTLRDSPGRVFSRDQLINKIFDEDYIANDRIIDAHVKNLRKKLPFDYIETVIGLGYRWRKEDEIGK